MHRETTCEGKRICACSLFFLLFVDTCIVKRERAEVPLTDLTQPCFVLVPSQDLDFQRH